MAFDWTNMYLSPAASLGSATGADAALPHLSTFPADFHPNDLDGLVPQELTGSDQTCIGITDPQLTPLQESMLYSFSRILYNPGAVKLTNN